MQPANETLEDGGGDGRSAENQALMQLLSLVITLALSGVGGLACGLLLSIRTLCDPLDDSSLFDDALFFNLPDEAEEEEEEEEELEEEDLKDPTIIRVQSSVQQTAASMSAEQREKEEQVNKGVRKIHSQSQSRDLDFDVKFISFFSGANPRALLTPSRHLPPRPLWRV